MPFSAIGGARHPPPAAAVAPFEFKPLANFERTARVLGNFKVHTSFKRTATNTASPLASLEALASFRRTVTTDNGAHAGQLPEDNEDGDYKSARWPASRGRRRRKRALATFERMALASFFKVISIF